MLIQTDCSCLGRASCPGAASVRRLSSQRLAPVFPVLSVSVSRTPAGRWASGAERPCDKSTLQAPSHQRGHQTPCQACVCSRKGDGAQAQSWVLRSCLAGLAQPSVCLSCLCPGLGYCHFSPEQLWLPPLWVSCLCPIHPGPPRGQRGMAETGNSCHPPPPEAFCGSLLPSDSALPTYPSPFGHPNGAIY